jgi:hypothetical protein
MHGDVVSTFAGLKTLAQSQIDGLRRQGVPAQAIIFDWADEPVAIKRAFVEWIHGNRFVFEDESTSGVVVDALIVVAHDQTGDPADLVAFDLNGHFASWLGVPVLALESVTLPRMSDALPVHRTPIDWLGSYRRGVVILDHKKARHFLESAGPVAVGSTDEGRALSDAMTYRPKIYVNSERAAA